MSSDHQTPCVTSCGRPAEGAFLCRWCGDELGHDLTGVGELAGELDTAVARLSRLGDTVAITHQGPPPIPFDPGAAEAQAVLVNTLSTWCREVSDRTGHELPADDEGQVAGWLRARMHIIRTHPAAAEIVDEITHAVRNGWRVVDRPPGKAFVGPCGSETPQGPCTVDLYARSDPSWPGQLDPRQAVIACPGCGAEWNTEKRREWLRDRLRGALATPREIAAAGPIAGCAVNVKTIRTWADRRVIMSYPNPTGGPARHEIGEVIDRATAISTRSARQAGHSPRTRV